MPERAESSPSPTLSMKFVHSAPLEKPSSSVREETDMLRPRKVPKRPSVTKSETALLRKRSHSSRPPRRLLIVSVMMAGVFTSCPYFLYEAT